MKIEGVLQLNGYIKDFMVWDDAIDHFSSKFYEKYNVYPNILLASSETYQKIDLIAQKYPERIRIYDDDINYETIETSNESYNGLSHFATENYELEFCIDYELTMGNFSLVFDEAPDFDGEPEPVPIEEKERVYHFKKSA